MICLAATLPRNFWTRLIPCATGVVGLAAVTLGCSDDEPDPLQDRDGFCEAWANGACGQEVLERCVSKSLEQCRLNQTEFCEKAVDANFYSRAGAEGCLDALTRALEDGELDAEERDIVVKFAGPCKAIQSGDGQAGDECTSDEDCATAIGFSCVIKPGKDDGTCQEPDVVAGGETCDGPTEVCDEGLFCDGENCIANKREGRSCTDLIPCEDDLNCEFEDGADEGTCRAKLSTSDECKRDVDCKSDICSEGREDAKICAVKIILNSREELCEAFGS